MKAVRIFDGVVVEAFDRDKAALTAERFFHPDFIAELVDAPAEVQPGWRFDGAAFTPPEAA